MFFDRLRSDAVTVPTRHFLRPTWSAGFASIRVVDLKTSARKYTNLKLFRLVSEVLGAVEAGAFHPIVGWQCKDCVLRSKCWAWM